MPRHTTRVVAEITTCLVLGASSLGAARLGAQEVPPAHRAQPERPSIGTHAETVASGWFEIETGIERDRLGPGNASLGPWGFVVEFYGDLGLGGPASTGFLAGPTWAARPWIILDAGFIAHVAGDQPRALDAGLTWNVGRLGQTETPQRPNR